MVRPLPWITLTTDFGAGSSYAAALKGAVLSINTHVQISDLSHGIPPQDIEAAAQFVADTVPHFPPETIHVVVVDPGVGTARALLCVEWRGQLLLAPDNGCWTSLERIAPTGRVTRLTESRFWAVSVSPVFQGRDILAPAAGHLTRGVRSSDLGVPAERWVRLELPRAHTADGRLRGQVLRIDGFGNAITNLDGDACRGEPVLRIGSRTVDRWVRTYGDAEPGALVALIGSSGTVELAVVNGSAAALCGLRRGDPVVVHFR